MKIKMMQLKLRRMVVQSLVASVLFVFSLWTAPAYALPILGLFNTGVDNNGVPLAGGSVDPHYSLILSADPNFPGPNAIVASPIAEGFWVPNSPTSKWIAPTANQAFPGAAPHPAGSYTYRLTFDLSGFVPGTAAISGNWAADNSGALFLNGVSTGNVTLGFSALVPFSIGTGFVAGINTLDFVVTNAPAGGSNPTGLRVEGISGTADPEGPSVPEPATLLLLGSGLASLGLGGWRRKRLQGNRNEH